MSAYTPWLDAWGQAVYGAPTIRPQPVAGPDLAEWLAGWDAGVAARPDQAAHDAAAIAEVRRAA